MSTDLQVIARRVDGATIEQRRIDGYINATALCSACGRSFNDYGRLKSTVAYLSELAIETGIPVSELVQAIQGGGRNVQGTWVHPTVAIHLAQWLSARFAVQVSKWVYEWMNGGAVKELRMPYHMRRYVKNRANVPEAHFSILTEMTQLVIAPMEEAGYTLPEKLLPDISEGRMFSRWLRDALGLDTDAMPYYDHYYEDGRVVRARAYPEAYLPHFRHHLRQVWIPEKSIAYFAQRDPSAIEFIAVLYPKQLSAA